MTTLTNRHARPIRPVISQAAAYEWRHFAYEFVHLYRRDQLTADWPALLTPWCEEDSPYPLRHDRPSVGRVRIPAPRPAVTCRACGHLLRAANQEAIRGQA